MTPRTSRRGAPAHGSDRAQRPVVITGGSGFVGCNLAHRLLSEGRRVTVFDNLSRAGVERNLAWLRATHGDLVSVQVADIRDAAAVRTAVRSASEVHHFAAQVAVTTSLVDPVEDFEVNGRGTLNVLEAIRSCDAPPPLVFTSTNKVYGDLADVAIDAAGARYEPEDADARRFGIGARRPLDFHSPYGCSKGAADQYVLDYARSFGLPTVVFRMSCIYGPRQFGTEDQGWVAHFLIRALEGKPIVVYGDGKQVRDALFVEDLVDAFLLARRHIGELAGQAFNIGGGPSNTTSLLELVDHLRDLCGTRPPLAFEDWRTGDQRWYVSDVRAFSEATGWAARTSLREGLTRLRDWLVESKVAACRPAAHADHDASHLAVQA